MEDYGASIPNITHKLQDTLFEAENLYNYNLLLQISPYNFGICITDPTIERCLLLENYQFHFPENTSKIIEELNVFFYEHEWLNAGFWKNIVVSVKNTRFSVVPVSLFDKNYAASYLNISSNAQPEEVLFYNKEVSLEAVVVFGVQKTLVDWLNQKYPSKKIKYIHHMSALLEGIVGADRSAEKKIYACVENHTLSIAVKEGNKILFHNSFLIQTADDFTYYCLYVMNVYGLSPETTSLVLLGNINNNSPEYQRIYKYVRKIEFIERPSILKYGFVFDEIPDHYYFDLFSLQLFE
jgi:hypothetical protein